MKRISITIVAITIAIMFWMSNFLDALGCTACGYVDPNCYTLTYHFMTDTDGYGGHRCFFYDIYDADDYLYDFHVKCGSRHYLVLASAVDMDIATGSKNGNSFACNWGGSASGRQTKDYVSFELPANFIDWEFNENYQSFKPLNEVELSSIGDFGSINLSDYIPHFAPDGEIVETDDYSVEHDFSKDIYNPNIPLVELYNVGYNNAWIHNSNGYEVQIIVDLKTFQWQMKGFGSGYPSYGGSNILWESKRFNLTNSRKKFFGNGSLSLQEFFGIDIDGWYVQSWRNWVNKYPTLNTLNGYTWTQNLANYSSKSYAGQVANFEPLSFYPDNPEKAYSYAMPCQTTFYVRYYDSFTDSYGQWMQYRAGEPSKSLDGVAGEVGIPQFITQGAVDGVTSSGAPIINDSITSVYDPIKEDYHIDTSVSGSTDLSIDNVKGILNTLQDLVGNFGAYVAFVFQFLPAWVSISISAILSLSVLVAFVRLVI